jgi:hypothetical protein
MASAVPPDGKVGIPVHWVPPRRINCSSADRSAEVDSIGVAQREVSSTALNVRRTLP